MRVCVLQDKRGRAKRDVRMWPRQETAWMHERMDEWMNEWKEAKGKRAVMRAAGQERK